jgi:hypothetical protein
MHDRARAISLLQQARDILVERLTERVLECRDTILEDALGLSYSSEIDAIQDQIGQRLNHVNLLLNNLPPVDEAPPPDDSVPLEPAPVLGYEPAESESRQLAVHEAAVETSVEMDSETATLAQSSVIYVAPDGNSSTVPNFQDFVKYALANDVDQAGRVLAGLLEVSAERGRECAQRFRDQLRERPQFLHKAMTLRQELASGSINGALILLWECFGLQGMESIAALQTLKARMAVNSAN